MCPPVKKSENSYTAERKGKGGRRGEGSPGEKSEEFLSFFIYFLKKKIIFTYLFDCTGS